MWRGISLVALAAAFVAPLRAQITIDFETKGDGSPWLVGAISGDEWSNLGVEFHSHYLGVGNPEGLPAYIFDSSPDTDPNIGTGGPTSGLPDMNHVMTVWDEANSRPFTGEGGIGLTLSLNQEFSELRFGFIDIEDNRMGDNTSIALWSGSTFFGWWYAPGSGYGPNNTFTEMIVPGVIGNQAIDRVDINLKGDGALAYVTLVPEPATVAAIFGLGALAFAAWMRTKRAATARV
jgi:hypothetical protein